MKKTGLLIGSNLFLTYEFLSGFISTRSLERWKRYPHPEDSRKKIFSYEELKERVKVLLPSAEELKVRIKAEEKTVEQTDEALSIMALPDRWMEFYHGADEHYYMGKISIDGKRAKDLAVCMAILRFLDSLNVNKGSLKVHAGFDSRASLLNAIVELVKEHDYYGLPKSYDRLRKKFYEFTKAKGDKRDILISEKFGNHNTLKRTEEHEAIILELYLKGNKPDMLETWANYGQVVKQELALEPISYSALKYFCSTEYVRAMAAQCRHGNAYYETHVRPFVLRKDPEFSFSLIAGDGWQPGRSVKHMFKGKEKIGTMTVWVWFDWKSRAILSYRIAPTETSEMIRQSFRDILSLHNDICPMSVMVDTKWSENKETKSLFEKANVKIQHKRAYNPKANIAERSNKELNRLHRKLDDHWVSITNHTVENVHNPEHVRTGKPMEESEFRSIILEIVNIYNNTPLKDGKTRMDVCLENINPEAKTIDPLIRTWIFGDKKIVTVNRGGFTIHIASKKYEYLVPDWTEFLKKDIKYNKVKVYYDERFMNTVDLYRFTDEASDENDAYICTCEPVERMNVAQIEQTEEDKKILGRHIKRGKKLDDDITKELEKQREALEAINMDRASVHSVSQDKYKEAMSTEVARQYKGYFEDQEREEGRRVPVTMDASEPMDTKTKFNKLNKLLDDLND